MSQQRIKIPRASDRTIAEIFRELGNQYGITSAAVSALAFSDIGQVSLTEEETDDWKALLDHDSYLIDSMSLGIGGLSITYVRGGQYSPEQKSAIYDEIILNWNHQQSPTNRQKLDIIALLNMRLRPFEPGRIIGGAVSDEQSQLLAIHQSTLERLESLNEDLIRQSSEFRRGLEEKFEEKLQQSELEYAERKKQLQTENQAFASDLKVKEFALEEKLKSIDDRDNTHVRREIRDRMLDDVKQRISQFGVSKTTERKRLPVFVGIAVLLSAFLGLLGWTGYEIHSMDSQYFSMLEAIQNISAWGPDSHFFPLGWWAPSSITSSGKTGGRNNISFRNSIFSSFISTLIGLTGLLKAA